MGKEVKKSGLAIASLILGILSFIPLVGVLLGIIAIILGIVGLIKVKKEKFGGKRMAIIGIILAILGILFTLVLYGSLFYFGFVATDGPFTEQRIQLNRQILQQDAGSLELYKQKFRFYPNSLKDLSDSNYTIYDSDFFGNLCYSVSSDKTSYTLTSAGPDKICNTSDDIY